VLAAIERIRVAEARRIEAQTDPTADADDRAAARGACDDAERALGWQWANVAALL